MPVARFQMPDGRIGRFEVPDGTTPDQAQSLIESFINEQPAASSAPTSPSKPVRFPDAPNFFERQLAKLPDIIDPKTDSQIRSYVMGAADIPMGGLQYAAHKLGGGDGIDTAMAEKEKQLLSSREGTGREGFDAYRMFGNVTGPAMLLNKALPYSVGAEGWARLPQLAKNVGVGSLGGGLFGLLTPTDGTGDFDSKKLDQVKSGAIIGGALPVGFEAVRTLGNLVRNATGPFREGYRTDSAKTWLSDLLGGSKPQVVKAIDNRMKTVPGSPVSTTDAIADANVIRTGKFGSPLVKVEEVADSLTGGSSDLAKTIATKQQAARADLIDSIGVAKGVKRTPEMIDNAIEQLKQNADVAYKKAFAVPVVGNPSKDKFLASIVKNPYYEQVRTSPDIVRLIESKNLTNKDTTEYLHIIKEALDKKLKAVGDSALERSAKREVTQLKNNIVLWLGNKNKLYDKARLDFSKDANIIKRMKIGEELKKALTSGTGVERPSSLATTVRRMEEELDTKLTASDQFAVNRVMTELSRDAEKKALGSHVDVKDIFDIVEKGKGSIKIPQLWNRPTSVAKFLMHMTGNDADMKVLTNMHSMMKTDPSGFARKYLSDIEPSKIPGVMQLIEKAAISGAAQGAAQPPR